MIDEEDNINYILIFSLVLSIKKGKQISSFYKKNNGWIPRLFYILSEQLH